MRKYVLLTLARPQDPFNRKRGLFYTWVASHFLTHPEAADVDLTDLTASTLVRVQNTIYPVLSIVAGLVVPAAIALQWDDWKVRHGIFGSIMLTHD